MTADDDLREPLLALFRQQFPFSDGLTGDIEFPLLDKLIAFIREREAAAYEAGAAAEQKRERVRRRALSPETADRVIEARCED